MHSTSESSNLTWSLEDSLNDIKNKKLRTGGRLLLDYCCRPFHRIIKMYNRGFSIDLNDSDSMHYVKKVLSNDATCPYNLSNYCWNLLFDIFPLIKELIINPEYCFKLYFNQLLIEVLYDYDYESISEIYKMKEPIYEEDIHQIIELYQINSAILDSKYLNLKPSLFLLYGEKDPDLAEWIMDNINLVPNELTFKFLSNLAFKKRFDLIEKINCYDK